MTSCGWFRGRSYSGAQVPKLPIQHRRGCPCADSVPRLPAEHSSWRMMCRSWILLVDGFIGRRCRNCRSNPSKWCAEAPPIFTAPVPSAASSMRFPFFPRRIRFGCSAATAARIRGRGLVRASCTRTLGGTRKRWLFRDGWIHPRRAAVSRGSRYPVECTGRKCGSLLRPAHDREQNLSAWQRLQRGSQQRNPAADQWHSTLAIRRRL